MYSKYLYPGLYFFTIFLVISAIHIEYETYAGDIILFIFRSLIINSINISPHVYRIALNTSFVFSVLIRYEINVPVVIINKLM